MIIYIYISELNNVYVKLFDHYTMYFSQERFSVHPNSKKQVFQALGSAFRNFKYLLTTKYILPHKHNRKRLKRPPFQYSHIPQNVWDKFVNSRLSTEFEVNNFKC